jgi:tetratricopeptide (TPR) repeat protein
MCLFETGKLKESCAELEKVYDAQPDNMAAAYGLATAYLLDDQVEKGSALIEKVFKELGSAEAHLIFGLLNLARHELPPAIDELKQATRLNPRLPTAHSQLGVAYMLSGARELAVQEFKQELEFNPRDFNANVRLGWLFREDGKLEEAEPLLRRALELRPDDPGALFQVAQLVQAQGKTDETVKLLEQVVTILPDYMQAHVLLARLYFKLKRNDDAKREQAIIERLTAEQQKRQPTAESQKRNPLLYDSNDRSPQKP